MTDYRCPKCIPFMHRPKMRQTGVGYNVQCPDCGYVIDFDAAEKKYEKEEAEKFAKGWGGGKAGYTYSNNPSKGGP